MQIVIPGNPVPKARHRHAERKRTNPFERKNKRFNRLIIYDPQDKQKKFVSKQIKAQLNAYFDSENKEIVKKASDLSFARSFVLEVCTYHPIPVSDSKAEKNLKLWGLRPHNIKPDGSNLLKFIEDCANKILYKDDCQIVKGSFFKKYSNNPRTEINIMPIESHEDKEMESILGIYGPVEISQLSFDCEKLCKACAAIENDANHYLNLKTIALIISRIAESNADLLQKVTKKSPRYFEKELERGERLNNFKKENS